MSGGSTGIDAAASVVSAGGLGGGGSPPVPSAITLVDNAKKLIIRIMPMRVGPAGTAIDFLTCTSDVFRECAIALSHPKHDKWHANPKGNTLICVSNCRTRTCGELDGARGYVST